MNDQLNKSKVVNDSLAKISKKLGLIDHAVEKKYPYKIYGSLISAVGTIIEVHLPNVKIGDLCKIIDLQNNVDLLAEVVALQNDKVRLLPFGSIEKVSQDCKIELLDSSFQIKVGDFLLGKIVNGFGKVVGNVVDNGKPSFGDDYTNLGENRPIQMLAPDPFDRPLIDKPIETGVKSIDLFNTCGLGQRVGIFAGPGVGKTTLMGMIIRNSVVDVVVVALIGERGREVKEFIELELGMSDPSKLVLVIATSDRPAVEQLKCAYVAQTVAEYFRDNGKKVLLFVDSITRFARAGREVGLSSGEPLTRGGYPPSVFLSFPKLMERAGNNLQGSITAFYTVLMEGDNISDDPIADEVKSIIDGHLVLSRKLAERGQFPAIDVLKSLSRIADRIISESHLLAARHIKLLLSKHDELEFLIRVGEYKPGQDKLADEAVDKNKKIIELLKQGRQDSISYDDAINSLVGLAR